MKEIVKQTKNDTKMIKNIDKKILDKRKELYHKKKLEKQESEKHQC